MLENRKKYFTSKCAKKKVAEYQYSTGKILYWLHFGQSHWLQEELEWVQIKRWLHLLQERNLFFVPISTGSVNYNNVCQLGLASFNICWLEEALPNSGKQQSFKQQGPRSWLLSVV